MKPVIQELSLLCPNCHQACLFPHHMPEYRLWNKCKHCGFMEEMEATINRAIDRIEEEDGKIE